MNRNGRFGILPGRIKLFRRMDGWGDCYYGSRGIQCWLDPLRTTHLRLFRQLLPGTRWAGWLRASLRRTVSAVIAYHSHRSWSATKRPYVEPATSAPKRSPLNTCEVDENTAASNISVNTHPHSCAIIPITFIPEDILPAEDKHILWRVSTSIRY